MHGNEGEWMMGFGHGWFGIIFWIVLVLVIAALLKYLFGKK